MPIYYPGHPLSSVTLGQESTSGFTVNDMAFNETSLSGRLSQVYYNTIINKDYTLIHTITDSQKSVMDSFYTTNKHKEIELYFQATGAYANCYFAQPPEYQLIGPGYWTLTNNLIEVQ